MTERHGDDDVRIDDQYYLVASARASRRASRSLSHTDLFGVFDVSGDIPRVGREHLGLFFHGMRHLDRLELYVNRDVPHFLESHVSADNVELVTDLTNADVVVGDHVRVPRNSVAVRRVKMLAWDRLYERIELRNYWTEPVRTELIVRVHADFADIFELRGIDRAARGVVAAARVTPEGVGFAYRGRDGRRRATTVSSVPAPATVTSDSLVHTCELAPGETWTIDLTVECELDGVAARPGRPFVEARAMRHDAEQRWRESQAHVSSSNEFLNHWASRSTADIAMLRSGDADAFLYAGIPWFATLFGRDSAIAALATLTFAPHIAAGTLRRLAALQGTEANPERDEQPGKIVHEVRDDEMAACGEIPFGRYYGSIDSTPLFLMLAAAYVQRTGDVALATELWPSYERALDWIDRTAGRDMDGFVAYARETPRGLVNQGWKDSGDAIFHADGRLATPPVALVEVQGYVYAAWRGIAAVARRLGKAPFAADLERRASDLKTAFHRAFWMEDEQFYALALDGERRQCKVVTSNPGHCLYSGIVPGEVAARVAARFLRDDLFCGWGVRTLAGSAARYNPMSYHNGSVWPHDNAILAAGLRRYGALAECLQVVTALFESSRHVEGFRLPELFCGFRRDDLGTLVPYPVACRPQAWAAASLFLFVEAMLGITIDVEQSLVTFDQPRLPAWIEWMTISDLRVGSGVVDVRFRRTDSLGSAVDVLRRSGAVNVIVRK